MPMTTPSMDAPEAEWDEFHESHGEAKVRMLMQGGAWPQFLHLRAVQWLAKKDAEVSARAEASQSEQINIARSAKDAAWEAARAAQTANKRATIALVIAAISAIMSAVIACMGIFLVHWDTIRMAHP